MTCIKMKMKMKIKIKIKIEIVDDLLRLYLKSM